MPIDWESIYRGAESEDRAPMELLPSRPFVCRILEIEDNEDRQFWKIMIDIAEGKWANYFNKLLENEGTYWQGYVYQSYSKYAMQYFMNFTKCVADSNEGFTLSGATAESFVGRVVGIHLKPEPYRTQSGYDRTRYKMQKVMCADTVRAKYPE